MLKKKNYFLIKFLKKNFSFKIPLQSSILLYGKNSKIFEKKIKKNNISNLILDRSEINLFIFILTLFTGKISFINYAKIFIKVINPKIIITFNDNDINFYKLKHFHPSKCFIAVQNGYRFRRRDFFDDLIEAKKKKFLLKIDYYLCFNNFYAKYCKKFIQFNSILHGSYRNNLVKIKKIKKLKKDLLFISQYYPVTDSIDEHSAFYSQEKKLLPILGEYCHENKLNLIIMLRNGKKNLKKYNDEMNFYNSFLKGKFKGVKENNSYNFIDKYENILTIDSTLGYEALTRNKKVFFFHNRCVKFNSRYYKEPFGWPKPMDTNNFSINKIDKKIIFKFLDKNLSLDYKKWSKINNKYFYSLISYNYKNTLMLKLINDYLSK